MSAILIFLVAVFAIAGWWLVQQGVMSKPWLESGPETVPVKPPPQHERKIHVGLGVFLGVVGALFALTVSGFFMRMEYPDWQTMPLPPVVWVNTALLVMGSLSLHLALLATDRQDEATVKIGLVSAGFAAFGFLLGQAMAWRQLSGSGYALTNNPANSFFYMITAIHALHILGGLFAWGRTTIAAFNGVDLVKLHDRISLCATYWHFLLFVWFVLLMVLVGWAKDIFVLCTRLLS